MNNRDKYKLRYWYINGERFNSATEAAAKCNMTRYAVKKVCGRTKGPDGNFIKPQKGCYSKEREWSDTFEKEDIHFDYINENPEITHAKGSFGYYKDKYYFNILFEDKAGFIPEKDWEYVYKLMLEYSDKLPNKSWSMKYKEKYHKD